MSQGQRFFVLITALFVTIAAYGHHPCKCLDKTNDHKYQGGDKIPLTWYSLQRLDHPGDSSSEPQYCYERNVTNHSGDQVWDVSWKVAGYWAQVLPPRAGICQALPLPGPLDIPHPNGPIHYGSGVRTQYSTTVYAPKDGWPSFTSAFTGFSGISQPGPLGGTLEVAVRPPTGEYTVVEVALRSSIDLGKEGNVYRYEFENMGKQMLYVFWDVPRTDEFQEQFYLNDDKPLILEPGVKHIHTVKSVQPAVRGIAAVLIRDADFKVISRGMASVYGFANGKTTFKHATEWQEFMQ